MEQESCPICFYEFDFVPEIGEPFLQYVTDCDHIFHYRCLLQWSKDCPLCRGPLSITPNIIRSVIYIHTGMFYKRINLNLNISDPLTTIKHLMQEVTSIDEKHFKIISIHIRQFNRSMEQIPINNDQMILSKILEKYNYEKFYISIRVDIKQPLRRIINTQPSRYEFIHESLNNSSNCMELKHDPETSSDCVVI